MISSDMILLRRPKKKDSKLYFKWINNKRLVEYNSIFKPISYVEHLEWFSSIFTKVDVKIFSIVEIKSNKLIGSCSLRKINKIEKSAELQIRIGESPFRNGGYGSEAIRLLVCYGFNSLGLKKIYLYVFEKNIRAIKAYQKNNFKIEKQIKNFLFDKGVYKSAFLMINYK